MKTQFMKTLLILGFLIGVGDVAARAQALSDGVIEADVSHPFIVKGKTLAAGKYVVKRVDDNNPQVLEIRSANGRKAVIFEAENAQTKEIPHKAELVFDKIGDQYFLSQIWASDTDIGYQLPKTKAQKRLESGGTQAERHSIAAKFSKRTK